MEKERKKLKKLVSYNDYFKMCKNLTKLNISCTHWTPSDEEMELLKQTGVKYFLGLYIWVLETEPQNMSEEERKFHVRINRLVTDTVTFYEDDKENTVDYSSLVLPIVEFQEVTTAVDAISLEIKDQSGNSVIDNEMIRKDFKILLNTPYCFGLCIWFMKHSPESAVTQNMKQKFSRYQTIYQRDIPMDRGNWYPTEQEIEEILIPNITICRDFIVWLIRYSQPETAHEKLIVERLQEILQEDRMEL